jgi:regulator of ribonuclease activity A
MNIQTSDLCDQFIDIINVALPIGFKNFGGKKAFYGSIVTVKCYENNPLVRQTLETDGRGKVLVVDGGGSLRCALMGDNMAEIALENNWSGVLIFGCIRDSAALANLNIGLKALNLNPVKSGKKQDGETNIIVNFANINFIPNQFIYCDEDGILVSPIKLHEINNQ